MYYAAVHTDAWPFFVRLSRFHEYFIKFPLNRLEICEKM